MIYYKIPSLGQSYSAEDGFQQIGLGWPRSKYYNDTRSWLYQKKTGFENEYI